MRFRFWERRKHHAAIEHERRQVRKELSEAKAKMHESERRILQIELEMQEDIMKQRHRASQDYFENGHREKH